MKMRSTLLSMLVLFVALTYIACGATTTTENAAGTLAISGTVTGAVTAGVTVTLSGTATTSATTDANGAYSFTGLAAGDYTVTPSRSGSAFTPTSTNVTLSSTNTTADFVSTVSLAISGTVTGDVVEGITVTLSGDADSTATTAADGTYTFSDLPAGDYTVTPTKTNTAFNPVSTPVTLETTDGSADFASAEYTTIDIDMTANANNSIKYCLDDGLASVLTDRIGEDNTLCGSGADYSIYRFYSSFDLSEINIVSTTTIVSAYFSFKQTVTGSPYTVENLMIDHINYDDSLTADDWVLLALASDIAENADTTSNVSITTDLRQYVQTDIDEGRTRTQLLMRFANDIGSNNNYITIDTVTDLPTLTIQYYQFAE